MFKRLSYLFTYFGIFFNCFSENFDEFEHFIEKNLLEWKVPGAAIAIVQSDKVLFQKGFGFLEYDKKEKVDAETIFQIGSVTKTFTALALGIQVDDQRFGWDDPLILHLPEFVLKEPYPTRFATARDLLAHRTGLPSFEGDLLGKLGYLPKEILFRIRFIEPATSFRYKTNYSNVGFFIAGQLLESLTKKEFEEAITKILLKPLEMKRSGFSGNLTQENVAKAHALKNGNLEVIPWDKKGAFAAAGAVTSTAKDMANWMKLHLNEGFFKEKELIKQKTLKEILAPTAIAGLSFAEAPPIHENSFFSYGLGWDTYEYLGHTIVEKGGALDGMRCVVTLIPDKKLGITVLANLNLTLFPELIRAKFLEHYLGIRDKNLFQQIKKKEEEISTLLSIPQIKRKFPPNQPLHHYTGTFENELYGIFKVFLQDKELILRAGPLPLEGKLVHFSADTFLLVLPSINLNQQKVTFTFGPDNKPLSFETESLGTFKKKN